MTNLECREKLAGSNIARLACALDNQPYIVPIRVDFSDGYFYSYATLGRKIEWMRQNPLVCLEVDEFTSPWHWTTIVVFGHYEELPASPAFERPRATAERLFQKHPMWWEPSAVPLAGHQHRQPIVFRVRIDRMTGRRTSTGADGVLPESEPPADAPRERWLDRLARRLRGRR
jgi:nitroimidazol reductase NimA-like FMN-containing flavoprotein (pyridoxamine 5'-phosphate oxidase superfamily)